MELLQIVETDFELDPVSSYTEQYLETKLNNYKFGLKGFIDYYKIDTESKTITICDLKTTSKSIAEFGETVEFYNYWLQAAIYSTLVINNVDDEYKDYQILFKFVVIDKYDQVYVFDVQEETLEQWGLSLKETLDQANYHYTEKNYSLPYQFLTGQVIL
tara:strand:- start:136 stop:612 length:477 start_codon:yes stop_codon:yes gene_type:complete